MTDRVMVDIETLGLDPGASIVSIGAVRFDAGELGDTFKRSVSLTSCEEAGLSIDAETLEWWLTQDETAKHQLVGGDELVIVLGEFAEWYGDADEIWANSPSFDCEMLKTAYKAVDITVPWNFYRERDFRTLSNLSLAADVEFNGVERSGSGDDETADFAFERIEKVHERQARQQRTEQVMDRL